MRKVTVSIYLQEQEDIPLLYEKVGTSLDGLHCDLVDTDFFPDAPAIVCEKGNDVRTRWPEKEIIVHIMSKKPSRFLDSIEFADLVFLHIEIEEDFFELAEKIRAQGKKVGVAFLPSSSLDDLEPMLDDLDAVLFLGLDQPGFSGQQMVPQTIDILKKLEALKEQYDFETHYDGGVTLQNASSLVVDVLNSGSAVLKAQNPKEALAQLRNAENTKN